MRTTDLNLFSAITAVANRTAVSAIREDNSKVTLHYSEDSKAILKRFDGFIKPLNAEDHQNLWRLVGAADETYVTFEDGLSMLLNGKILGLESLLDPEAGFIMRELNNKKVVMKYDKTSFLIHEDEMLIPVDALNAMYKPVYDPLDEKYTLIVVYMRNTKGSMNVEPLQFYNATQRIAMKQAYNLPLSVYQDCEVIGVHGIKGSDVQTLDWKTGAFTDVRKDWA